MAIAWKNEETKYLLKLYKQEQHLYNSNLNSYRNPIKRFEALQRITAKLKTIKPKVNADSIKKKVKNLRSVYTSELMRIAKKRSDLRASGQDIDTDDESSLTQWWAFDEMKFLNDHIYQRKPNVTEKHVSAKIKSDEEENDDAQHQQIVSEFTVLSTPTPDVWRRNEITLLIKLFKKHEHLYNTSHSDYRHREKRDQSFNDILTVMTKIKPNLDTLSLKAKLRGIRTNYTTELQKMVKRRSYLSSDEPVSSWWCFDQLHFLDNFIQHRKCPTVAVDAKNLPRHKTGEIFVNDVNQFTFLCTHCHRDFAYAKDFQDHVLQEHLKEMRIVAVKEEIEAVEEIEALEDELATDDNYNDTCMEELPTSNSPTQQNLEQIDVDLLFVGSSSSKVVDKPFKCNICGQRFRFEHILNGHRKINHEPNDMDNDLEEDAWIECVECNAKFISIIRLQKHTKSVHRSFTCSHCNAEFRCSKNLKGHIRRMHLRTEPRFTCEYCNKKFKEKGNLVQHIRTHTGEKPYKCDRCDKSFGWSSYLRIHRRFHDKSELLYQCAECGQRFASNGMSSDFDLTIIKMLMIYTIIFRHIE